MQKKVNLSTFVITIIAAVLATFIPIFNGYLEKGDRFFYEKNVSTFWDI